MDHREEPAALRGYGEKSFVSWHNFEGRAPACQAPFLIHDVTLRDGEQQAGVIFSKEEKIRIGLALDALGVDRIEAGMVAVSQEDRQTIQALVDHDLKAEVWAVVRSVQADIRQAVEIGVDGVGIIVLANDQYCRVFGWSADEAIGEAANTADIAKSGGLRTTMLIADSSRMHLRRLEQIVDAANRSGLFDAVALMDTFGALNPAGATHLVRAMRNMTSLAIEFHAHNDFGLATANSLAAIEAGADVVHTSVIGLGERVGNAPLEEVAIAAALLHERPSNIDLGQLHSIAALVQNCSGVSVAANKAVVGQSYSRIESGGVAREYLRLSSEGEDVQWLFPFAPALVGADQVELVIGKGSGLANIEAALKAERLQLDAGSMGGLLAATKSKALELHRLLAPAEFKQLALEAGAYLADEQPQQRREAR